MITELTPQQEKNIAITRKKYLDIFYNPKNKDIPKEVYVEQYSRLYEFIGVSKPKQVIVMDSPFGVQMAYNGIKNNCMDNLWYSLSESLVDNLRVNLWGNLGNNLEDNLRDNLWDNLWDNLVDNLWGNLGNNLWGNLENNLKGSLWDNFRTSDTQRAYSGTSIGTSFSHYGESTDLYWVAFYMYAVENFDFVPKEMASGLRNYEKIITTAPTMLNALFTELAIVSRTPTKCFRDSEGRLHNDEGGMAVEFADGWGLYCINGVTFEDKKLYDSIVNKTITAEGVAKLDNTEHRMIALKYLSPAEFIKGSKAKQVGLTTAKGNTLYKGSFGEVGEVWFLRFKCPSTGREYIEFTNPTGWEADIKRTNGGVDIYNPDVLQAYSFVYEYAGKEEHLSLDDYLSMKIET